MLKLFISFEFDKVRRYFATKTVAKLITLGLFLIVFLFVGSGIYFFFLSGFRYINLEATKDIQESLTLFIYELFLVILGGVIIISSMISGLFTLFRGGYNNWIISSPRYTFFPKVVLIKSLMSSLLPSVIMFLPAVIAFNKVYSLSIVSLLFIMVSVFLFLVTLSALTLSAVVIFGTIYRLVKQKIGRTRLTVRELIALLVIALLGVMSLIWGSVKNIDLVQVFKAENVDADISIATIGDRFLFLPTHPFAMEILHWQTKETLAALFYFMVMVALTTLALLLWNKISPLFYPLWQRFQEGSLQGNSSARTLGVTYQFEGGRALALFKKEALVSFRNLRGVLWFSFLLLIWLLQIGSNIIIGNNVEKYQPDIASKLAILESLQFIIAIYFISSFTLRFVFPSFSAERKTSWILKSAPLHFKKIFFGKYFFYSAFFCLLGFVMSSISSAVLGLSVVEAFYPVMLLVSTILAIVTYGLTLGAIFPNKETDDPEVISTSMSGLFFTASALAYGAFGTWALYTTIKTTSSLSVVTFIGLNSVVVIGLLLLVLLLTKKRILV